MYEASAKYDIKMNPVVLKFSIEVPGLAKVEVPFNLSDSHPIASGSWVYGPFENYIDVGGSISITGTGTLSVSAGVDFTGQEYSRNHVQYFKGTAVAGAWFTVKAEETATATISVGPFSGKLSIDLPGFQKQIPIPSAGASFQSPEINLGVAGDMSRSYSLHATVSLSGSVTASGSGQIYPVPEPSSYALLVSGLCTLSVSFIGSRKRR